MNPYKCWCEWAKEHLAPHRALFEYHMGMYTEDIKYHAYLEGEEQHKDYLSPEQVEAVKAEAVRQEEHRVFDWLADNCDPNEEGHIPGQPRVECDACWNEWAERLHPRRQELGEAAPFTRSEG